MVDCRETLVVEIAAVEEADAVVALLRSKTGEVLELSSHRWIADADASDEQLLAHAVGPVLDIGCGPGRHVAALERRNISVLGMDMSEHAVLHARKRRRPVVLGSVFDTVPRVGDWATVLLLDGNIGIGGDPVVLLNRVVSLLKPNGRILVEIESLQKGPVVDIVRLELDGVPGPWFSWAHVDVDTLQQAVDTCGLHIADQWCIDDRHFLSITGVSMTSVSMTGISITGVSLTDASTTGGLR